MGKKGSGAACRGALPVPRKVSSPGAVWDGGAQRAQVRRKDCATPSPAGRAPCPLIPPGPPHLEHLVV